MTLRYVELPEVRNWLELDDDQVDVDVNLEGAIAAVENEIDSHCGRTFATATGTPAARIVRSSTVVVDSEYRSAIADAAAVTLLEGSTNRTTWSTLTNWWAEPDDEPVATHVVSTSPLPKWLRITADWGWPNGPPPEVTQAIKIRSAGLFGRRHSPDGVAGNSQFGVVYVSRYTDPDLVRLLHDLVRPERWGIA